MSSIDYEFDLGETERAMVDTAHRFAKDVMRPVGQELDKMVDPQQTIATRGRLFHVLGRGP